MNVSKPRYRICILGGTGFVGSELVSRLATAGHSVRVFTRLRSRAAHLLVLPTVEVITANVHDPRVLSQQLADMDVVINLVGILNEPLLGGHGFRATHADLTEKIIVAARTARVRRLLQMSALGADAHRGPSDYLRTKGQGENHIRAADSFIDATIFRPSVIFGPGDSLTNRFAGLLKLSRGVIPLARAGARFAPIYVGDVADAFLRALEDKKTIGKSYDLCGPDVMTLADIVRLTASTAKLPCFVIPVPNFLARIQGVIMGLIPGKPFSLDNYRSLTVDSICKEDGCAALGIKPQQMASIIPTFLGRETASSLFSRLRRSR